MKYTSQEAAKLLKSLNEQHELIVLNEQQSSSFVAAVSEDIESVRPEYDYAAVQDKLDSIERDIRKIKHAVNIFNSTHNVPGFDMTIDQALVFIPQLTAKKNRLFGLANAIAKQRERGAFQQGGIIDYRYANYDVETAKRDYKAIGELISKLQSALDLVNSTETMEIEL